MNYKKILDDVIELHHQNYVIVSGYFDLIKSGSGYFVKDFKKENFYTILGHDDIHGDVFESIVESCYNVERSGEYTFNAILNWNGPEYEEYGRIISPGYYEISHLDTNFVQTIEQRERSEKINNILYDLPF